MGPKKEASLKVDVVQGRLCTPLTSLVPFKVDSSLGSCAAISWHVALLVIQLENQTNMKFNHLKAIDI
jgi:hypothetical protein